MKKTKRMKIRKNSMDHQMEFLKPATAARMNSRATSEKNILNSIPKNLYRFAFSGKFTFLSQAQITFILRSNSNHYISFLPKIKFFGILICVLFANLTLTPLLKKEREQIFPPSQGGDLGEVLYRKVTRMACSMRRLRKCRCQITSRIPITEASKRILIHKRILCRPGLRTIAEYRPYP